jgi:hypothetical protein
MRITSLYFSPKVTSPERLYGVKIMPIQAITISHLGNFKANIILFKPATFSELKQE